MLCLKAISGDERPSEIKPHSTPFWVQVYDLPLSQRTSETAQALGNKMGEFMEWDASETGNCGMFLRLRTRLDLTKPLRRGSMTLSGNGKPSKVFFKYERLQEYCYLCGLLGHTLRDCADCNEEDGEETNHSNYGPWLRASLKKHATTGMGQHSIAPRKKLIFKPEGTAVPFLQ